MHVVRRARVNRALNLDEKGLIMELLSHLLHPERYIEQLEHLRVVGQCDCGCPTIDLAPIEQKIKSTEVP